MRHSLSLEDAKSLPRWCRPVALLVLMAAVSLLLSMMIPRHPKPGHETIFSKGAP